MVTLYFWENLKAAHQNADGIRDHKVQAERHKAAIELARLEAERRYLDEREIEVRSEIHTLGKPAAWARFKRREGALYFALFLGALFVAVGSTLWALQIMDVSWSKQSLVAFSIVVSVGGFEFFWRYFGRCVEQSQFRRWLVNVAVVAVLCGVLGSALLAVSRGLVTSLEAKQSQAATLEIKQDESSSAPAEQLEKMKKVSRILDIAMVLTLVCLAIGAEIVAGLAFFEAHFQFADAAPILGLYKEVRKIQRATTKNEHEQESARRGPEILYEELTAGALYSEIQEEKKAMLKDKDEKKNAIEVRSKEKNGSGYKDDGSSGIGAAIIKTAIGFVTAIVLLGALVGWALAADTVVIGIDLTTSADSEFGENLSKVEEIIKNQKTPGTRIVVLGIRADSFGAQLIFDDSMPREPGRFGQQMDAWRLRAINRWRAQKPSLKPTEKGSDIFGFLMRAAVIFADDPDGEKRLLVLSDMRHVGLGYNFELINGLAKIRLDELDSRGLLANFQAVKVWILGAHTSGLSPVQWMKLKEFWVDYLKRAGATLVIFSPSRRL